MDTNNYFLSDSGIGLETTILFAREGAAVLMADISESALEKAVAKVHGILPDPPRLETIKCDVSKEADGKLYVLRILDLSAGFSRIRVPCPTLFYSLAMFLSNSISGKNGSPF